jgi:protease II
MRANRSRWMPAICLSALALTESAGARQAQTPYAGHGAESVPREKVAKYAPTPLPGGVTRRIQMMLDVRGAVLGTLSPDGKRLFFTWNITGTPNVWRLDGPKSFPVQLTGGEDPTRLSGVTPDGKYLVLSRDVGGQEDPGLYLQLADGGPLTEVHHKKGTRAGYGFSTADSKTIYFSANDIAPDSYAIYRYDIAARKRELVFDQPGLWTIADHREGQGGTLTLLLAKATGALSREFAEYDVATRMLTPLFGQNETVEYDAGYAPAAGELFVVTNKLGEFRRLYKWKRGGDLVPVTAEMSKDVSGFGIDDARRRLYYTVNDGGYQRLRAIDAATLAELKLPVPQDADAVSVGTMTPDGRFATIGVETAKAPRSSYVFDWQTQTLTPWMLPSAPEIDPSKFAVAKLDSYPARDGMKIPMFVRYPAQCAPEANPADPCPVVIEFHGGPEGQARPSFSGYAQLFIDSGFIFVQPNVRGSDGYGKAWLNADNGPKRLDVITDIEDAGKALRARFTRNGKVPKVAIVGGSYGGYSALVGMTMFAGTYDAGVSIVGISNLQTFLQNTAPYRRKLRASEYGDPEKDAEALKKLSPVTYIDRVKSPLLMIQGLDDPRVPAGESIQMQEALEKRSVQSRLVLVEGEGHGAARRGGQVIMIGNMLRFLEEQCGKGAAGTQ